MIFRIPNIIKHSILLVNLLIIREIFTALTNVIYLIQLSDTLCNKLSYQNNENITVLIKQIVCDNTVTPTRFKILHDNKTFLLNTSRKNNKLYGISIKKLNGVSIKKLNGISIKYCNQ